MSKKILTLVLAFTLVFSLGLTLVSCGGDDNGDGTTPGNTPSTSTKETYTVTVKDKTGAVVAGVELLMVNIKNGMEIPAFDTKTTGEDGKASFEVKPGTWKVRVEGIPSSIYILPTADFAFSNNAVTITLSTKPKYTVKLVDQNNSVVVGASVQMCEDSCVPLVESEDGVYSKYAIEKEYKAQVTALPEGYSFKAGTTSETKYEFEEIETDVFEVTIEVNKNN